MENEYIAQFDYYIDCSIWGRKETSVEADSMDEAVRLAKEWALNEEKALSISHRGADIWLPLTCVYGPEGEYHEE